MEGDMICGIVLCFERTLLFCSPGISILIDGDRSPFYLTEGECIGGDSLPVRRY